MCIAAQHRPQQLLPAETLFAEENNQHKLRNSRRPRNQTPTQQPHHPIVVQHNYHDHANDVPPSDLARMDPQDQLFNLLRGSASSTAPFPIKLYDMLHRVEQDGFAHIVSWQPHGRCFVIHQTPEFIRELLPRYFKLSKIASFQRQLNLYGFARITQGMDKGGYYHECFLRGMPFLTGKIHRIKVKGTGVRGKSNPDQEPNLWSMNWVGASSSAEQEEPQQQPPELEQQQPRSWENRPPLQVLNQQQATATTTTASNCVTASTASSLLPACTPSSSPAQQHPRQQPQQEPQQQQLAIADDDINSSDVLVMEFGMPFHPLYQLPDFTDAASTSAPERAPSSSSDVMEDPVYMDQMLSSMLAKETVPSSSSSAALDQLLVMDMDRNSRMSGDGDDCSAQELAEFLQQVS